MIDIWEGYGHENKSSGGRNRLPGIDEAEAEETDRLPFFSYVPSTKSLVDIGEFVVPIVHM